MTVALVASTGGHLAELMRLRPRFEGVEEVKWITFDSTQSRSLLADEDVIFVPYTGPRQLRLAAANTLRASGILRRHRITGIVSTGAAIAVSFMLAGRRLGLPCVYIECAARSTGPSLTARLLYLVPGVSLFTQYPTLESERWHFAGSVLDGYTACERPAPERPLKVVVTVGSLAEFGFARLIEEAVAALPADAEVFWQTGPAEVGNLPIRTRPFVSDADLRRKVAEADVVIAHAGIGSALMALDAGRPPILIPRLRRHSEHVDDHQEQIAGELARRGLAFTCDARDLSTDLIERASQMAISHEGAPPISLPLGP